MLLNEYAIEGVDLIYMGSVFDQETNTVVCKFYNTLNNQIYLLRDGSGFKPFFYVRESDITENSTRKEQFAKFINENKQFEIQTKTLYDGIENKQANTYKLMANNFYSAYKRYDEEMFPNQYEYLVKHQDSFSLSNGLIPCCIYQFSNGNLYRVEPELETNAQITLKRLVNNVKASSEKNISKDEYLSYIEDYTKLLSQPVPFIRRCALDIEVEAEKGKFPSLKEHTNPITMVSFNTNDGYVNVLTYPLKADGDYTHLNPYIEMCRDEQHLIERTFELIEQFPIILTYNGDNFDLAYIFQRSKSFPDIDQGKNPILFKTDNINTHIVDAALLKNGLHIDLYRLFKNVSLHNYGFNHKYNTFGLNEVAQAMIGEGKIEVEGGDINALPINKLAEYCLHDAELTLKLTTYSDDLVMKLLFTISRITKATLEDIDRYGISNWAKSMMYYEHRKKDILIPTRDSLKLKGMGQTKSKIEGKKFQGAFVMEPIPGSHFNVVCLDFGSLYPSIIKTCNLSYETINCGHAECNERNVIRDTTHYYCNKRQGVLSLIIGVMRDLRVEYFKKLAKDKSLTEEQRDLYDAITQASKVILNGSYGVIGSESFSMFCLPVAEGVTAIGRDIIQTTIKYAESLGVKTLYSDTDSIFILSPTKEQIQKLIDFSRLKYAIDLEIDKTYRYIIFSNRKKNYFGVHTDGKLDTKGLTGKKSNIPLFIRNCFRDITLILKDVNSPEDLKKALTRIEKTIRKYLIDLRNKNYDINDLAFNSVVNRNLEEYGQRPKEHTNLNMEKEVTVTCIPQHVRVAMELQAQGENIGEKSSISYIKTVFGPVQPSKANKNTVDISKYVDTFKTALSPVLDTLNLSFDDFASYSGKQVRLDTLF